MVNIGTFFFLLSCVSLIAKLVLSQYVDTSELDIEEIDSSDTYVFDFIILFSCFCYIRFIDKVFYPIFISFLILMPTYTVATYLNDNEVVSGISTSLRWFLPFFMFAHYASYLRRHSEHYIHISNIFSVIITICIVIGFLYFPMATNRFDGENDGFWWPAYFNNLHTTCYVAAAIFFMQYVNYSYGYLSRKSTILIFLLVFFAITLGWGIRTVSLLLLIFAYTILHVSYLSKIKIYNYFAIFSSILLSAIWFVFYFDWDYYSRVTSGRLSMYEAKFDQLSQNGFVQWVIGNGAGSDIIETGFWWGAKGAHSDLITSLVEGGLIFFFIFVGLHYFLYMVTKGTNAKYIVLPVLFSGIVSNGFLSRPVAMYVLLLTFVGFYAMAKSYKGVYQSSPAVSNRQGNR